MGAIGLYAVYDRNGTEIMDNATMQEVAEKMERLMLEDMIKALKCVGSQDSLGDCYADCEVYMHMEDENYKRLVCGTGKDLYIKGTPTEGCPYYQKKYGVCPEDGDLYC